MSFMLFINSKIFKLSIKIFKYLLISLEKSGTIKKNLGKR